MKKTILVLSLLLFAIGLKAADTSILWQRDTSSTGVYKNAIIGGWFSDDDEYLFIPQGNQLFKVRTLTGTIVNKINLDYTIKYYHQAGPVYLLGTDTNMYVYNKSNNELINVMHFPERLKQIEEYNFFSNKKSFLNSQVTPDGKTIFTRFELIDTTKFPRATLYVEAGFFDVAKAEYQTVIPIQKYFSGAYSPNGDFFIANERDYSGDQNVYTTIYDSKLSKKILDKYILPLKIYYRIGFSADANRTYMKMSGKIYTLDLYNNFYLDSVEIKGLQPSYITGINDSLLYLYASIPGGLSTPFIASSHNYNLFYKFEPIWGGNCVIAPQKKYIMMYYDNLIRVHNIPYDKLTKTDEEISNINRNIILSPNPTNQEISYKFYSDMDRNINYSIYDLNGKLITTENLGFYNSGYINGKINVANLPEGNYIIEFCDENKIESGNFMIFGKNVR